MNEELIRELESVTISQNVFIKARNVINNYWTHSEELVIKKLIRNWAIAERTGETKGYENRKYGNLQFVLDKRTQTIMHLRNSNFQDKGCFYDRQLKKEINRYMGIDQLLIEEGIKRSELVYDLPIFSRAVFLKTIRFVQEGTYLDIRKMYAELIKNGTITEEGEYYKYILTDIGTIKVFNKNQYISYVDFNDEIMGKTREEVA